MDATSPPPTIAMDTTEEGGPINSLPEDLLRNIFEKFNSSWGPWVPWAPRAGRPDRTCILSSASTVSTRTHKPSPSKARQQHRSLLRRGPPSSAWLLPCEPNSLQQT